MNELSGSCWVFTALSSSAGSSAYATAENAPAQPGVSMPAKPGTSESANASAAASTNAAVSVRADPKAAPRRAAREAAASDGCDPVERCAVEYTRLFVGPPRPAAAPWETMHRAGGSAAVGGATVGFGQATFEMRALLREAGLEVKNENNQYEDHIGIELLYLSALCARAAEGEEGAVEEVRAFAEDRLLAWLPFLRAAAEEAAPDGYLPLLLALADALLRVPSGASA